MENTEISLKEASEQLSVPLAKVRHLCNSGLIPGVRRNAYGHRLLSPAQVDLLEIFLQMRQAGFRPKELRQYSRLYRQGSSTGAKRLAMLTTRKHQLRQEILDRQKAVDFIERQEENYQQNRGER